MEEKKEKKKKKKIKHTHQMKNSKQNAIKNYFARVGTKHIVTLINQNGCYPLNKRKTFEIFTK